MTELSPEELDEAVALEAEHIERERNKRRLLVLLDSVPADSPLWDRLLVMVVGEFLLETGER